MGGSRKGVGGGGGGGILSVVVVFFFLISQDLLPLHLLRVKSHLSHCLNLLSHSCCRYM